MCPECGARRGRVVKDDEDEDGQPLRLRRCTACRHEYPTIEVPILDPTVTFYSLAARRRDYERYRKRDRRRRGPMSVETDRGRWIRKIPYLEVRTRVRWRSSDERRH